MDYPSLVITSLGDAGGSAYYRILMPLLLADSKGMIQLRMPQPSNATKPHPFVFYPIEVIKALRPDAIMFHRSHTDVHRKYMNDLAHEFDLLKVYTIDDWVGKVPKESPHFIPELKNADKEIKKAIGLCDKLIVTNDVLANVYGYKQDTTIIPNYLPRLVWDSIYKTVFRLPNKDSQRKIRIGWSGGMGHPGDLAILKGIADQLGDKVRWVFLGMTPPDFDVINSEIHTGVAPNDYAKALYGLNLDLALAPLLNNDFNKAKSNLRILEYGACGYPIIASNVEPYKSAPITKVEYKVEWWVNEINKKISDLDALKVEGLELQKWVWDNYTLEDHLHEYSDLLSTDGKGFEPSVPEIEEKTDIVITTRNQLSTVKDCVDSVLESLTQTKYPYELVITDNASDETGMQEYLKELDTTGKATVLFSDKDHGYVLNVNKGLKLHPNRDAIILNSDTVVNGNWADRLHDTAYLNDRIASVTPFTNNGTICSYPNPSGSEMEKGLVRFYDDVASELKSDEPLELPTPVGFCMYVKRTALAEIGLFDPHAFVRGYGEENEWALRGHKRVWRHVLGQNVYVGHSGSLSFGPEKQTLLERSVQTLITRWQHYGQLLQQWNNSNMILPFRQQLDMMTITKTNIIDRTLFIAHSYGGGLETYLQEQIKNHPGSLIIRNDLNHSSKAKLEVVGEEYHNLPQIDTRMTGMHFLADFFKKSNVKKISVQTTFGYDYNFPIWITNLARLIDVPVEVMLHDYWMICPRLRLVDKISYCGEPEVTVCNQCLVENGSGIGQVDVGAWREMYTDFLNGATKIYTPSQDTATRLKKYFNHDIEVVPHESDITIGEYSGALDKVTNNELRIAIIGNVSPDKGSLVIRDLAEYCRENKLPIKFVVIGNLMDSSAVLKMIPPASNLTILGVYQENALQNLILQNKCHMSFFPALWPETYSYTLSHAFRAGLYPVAFDIGAIAERIREKNFGKVLPFELSKDIPNLYQALIDIAKEDLKLEIDTPRIFTDSETENERKVS